MRLGAGGLATLLLAGAGALPAAAQSNGAGAGPTGSTRAGVYSENQATRGRATYQLVCASCHTAASHAGPVFAARWEGHTLWELYRYISEAMPKSEPGSLSVGEYTRVTAYLLKINGMPAGPGELLADSLVLKKIRIDLKAADPSRER